MIDATHDPKIVSWVESANDPATDFPPQNLPLGAFRRSGTGSARTGVAIGDMIVDIAEGQRLGLFAGEPEAAAAACGDTLNGFMALGSQAWTVLRRRLSELLRADTPQGKRAAAVQRELLVPQDEAAMQLPVRIGDYSDFYASLSHASNVGSMLRPDNPLLPNYKWVPIGYHGRASSIARERHAGTTPRRAEQRR